MQEINGSSAIESVIDGETAKRLERWANWATEGGAYSSYVSPFAVLISQNVQQSRGWRPMPESDDEALETEKALASLKRRSIESYAAIFHYFLYRVSIRELARRMGLSKQKANEVLIRAIVWVEGYLDSKVIHSGDQSDGVSA